MAVDDPPRETSAATTGLLVRYVERRAGPGAVAAVLERSGVPWTAEELRDEARWFSYDDRIALFEAMVDVLGDPDATYDLGAWVARSGVNPSLILLLRALGSPRQVFRQLPRAVTKFSTTSTMRVLEVGEAHAVIRYDLHDGYQHSRLDCRYAQGLFSAVPTLFGLPAARVLHDECESDGLPACLYHVTWDRRRRTRWSRGSGDDEALAELVALRSQFEALQDAAADLVASEDLDAALGNVIARAGAAVLAPSYLGVVRSPDGGAPVVHSSGLTPEEVTTLADRLLAGDDLGSHTVVVDIETARRHHGRLAVLYPEGTRGPEGERALLAAYAGHAGAVLDQIAALEASRRGESRARALLSLAHELASAGDDETVARTVAAALPRVVGCVRSSVLRWDPDVGLLQAIAACGLHPDEEARLLAARVRPDDMPEFVEMLATRAPTTADRRTASPKLASLLHAVGAETITVVPLLAGSELLGIVTAGWAPGDVPDGPLDEVVERLRGVADQASGALQNTRLLAAVRHQSLHDALTGLPNRVLFSRDLTGRLSQPAGTRQVAVLFCDLDRFKAVNDELGHAAGDELLRQVAARLRTVVRANDLVGRLSGDEFALILEVVDEDEAALVADRVIEQFVRPFRLEGRAVAVTISVGVAVGSPGQHSADGLLRAADEAMYDAKQRGRNQVVASGGGPGPVRFRATPRDPDGPLQQQLTDAIAGGELRVRFSPVVALRGVAHRTVASGPRQLPIVGTHASVRWDHPQRGPLSPATLLAAEPDPGVGVELDLWTLAAAAAAHSALDPGVRSGLQLVVPVGIASVLDERVAVAVRSAARTHDLGPGQLVLEVVENRPSTDLSAVAEQLAALRHAGARVALGGFGAADSTLASLYSLPFDRLTLDRQLVAPLAGDGAAVTLVRGVLAMARELGVEVAATGVEERGQLLALESAGCALVRGALLGPPSGTIATGVVAVAPPAGVQR